MISLLALPLFTLFTAAIFAVWAAWVSASFRGRLSESLTYAALLGASQIVLTQIALGAMGWLAVVPLVIVNAIVTSIVAIWAKRRAGSGSALRDGFVLAPPTMLSPVNIFLLLLAVGVALWIIAAAWLLAPRGVDDLTYHLPPLYEYAQTGRIRLLPVELRAGFAMPLGGDFLYLWPLVLLGSDTWIDMVQLVVAAVGAVMLYGLAMTFDVSRRDGLFCALLFFLTPVVLGQSASNYVDVIVAVVHLVLLYAAVRYYQTGETTHLVMGGIATGFALGVKYHLAIAVIAVQPLLVIAAVRGGLTAAARSFGLYALAALPLPVYWYARNAIELGFPLYPYSLSVNGLREIGSVQQVGSGVGGESFGSALSAFFDDPHRFITFLLQDPGLGSLNGGLGLAFWGLALPAFVVALIRSIRQVVRGEWLPLLFWLQPLVFALAVLAQIDINRVVYNMRLAIVFVPIGLIALATSMPRLRREIPGAAAAVFAVGVVAALLAVGRLPGYELPHFRLRDAVADRVLDRYTSGYRYHVNAAGDLPNLAGAWDALDTLTRPDNGMDVYMAAAWPVYFGAPLFGNELQNRVVSLDRTFDGDPDALLFFPVGAGLPLFSVGRQYLPNMVGLSGRYSLIDSSPLSQLWLSNERLAEPVTQQRLLDFFERRFAAEIDTMRAVARALPPDATVVTSSTYGPALKYLESTGELRSAVFLAPPDLLAEFARRSGADVVVTLDEPLANARSRPLISAAARQAGISLYRNEGLR